MTRHHPRGQGGTVDGRPILGQVQVDRRHVLAPGGTTQRCQNSPAEPLQVLAAAGDSRQERMVLGHTAGQQETERVIDSLQPLSWHSQLLFGGRRNDGNHPLIGGHSQFGEPRSDFLLGFAKRAVAIVEHLVWPRRDPPRQPAATDASSQALPMAADVEQPKPQRL
jgi:hypothetical protein